jgi:hypothetical protein
MIRLLIDYNLFISFRSKQIEDINLPGILNQRDVKQALPSNLNYKNNPIITYKFSKMIGQMIFNYNLMLKNFDMNSNWKPACKCEKFLSFVNPTYKHFMTGDLAIIKQIDLQSIRKVGAKFHLSNHLKPSDVLSGFNCALDLFIGKWCKKEKINKNSFQNWKNLIITRARKKIHNNANNRNIEVILYSAKIKQAIANIRKDFVIAVNDKANNNFAIIYHKLMCDVLSKELSTTNT